MTEFVTYILYFFLLIAILLMALFVLYSVVEKEKRATGRALISLVLLLVVAYGISFLPIEFHFVLDVILLLVTIVILLKFGNRKIDFVIPDTRYDERDVMFSRNTLVEGTEKFENYYKNRPENRESDDNFRQDPGLMAPGATFYNELFASAADASFAAVDMLQPIVEQSTASEKTQLPVHEISKFIKNWALKLGAEDVGFTSVKPYSIYSHIGRGKAYGKEVELHHKFAIAFTVEMNHEAIRYNPRGPVVMESAQQYLNAGQIAVQLAQFIRNLGFEARAHIDANYRLICPIVAQDAGLGTIGRMGLLMTPKFGPRVRLGVVTTDLELPIQEKPVDYSVIHFCEVCKKCAENCPSQSISHRSVKKESSPKRWRINQESCFAYWCKIGTDCGRCMAVCPYSHPNNFMHNIIRRMIKRNPITRYFALKLDDFYYGRKPRSANPKNWLSAEKI